MMMIDDEVPDDTIDGMEMAPSEISSHSDRTEHTLQQQPMTSNNNSAGVSYAKGGTTPPTP
jgi:hypothetical protein